MNKESIYKIIGYHGKYTDSVKKAIKKLLKENHPDHKGNEEIFKLVNEVKKELEENQVSFKWNDNELSNKYDDIDYDYCNLMIEKLKREKTILLKEKNEVNEQIIFLANEYRKKYRESINGAEMILNKNNYQKSLKKIKITSVIATIILIIIFIIAIIKNNIVIFITFGLGCFVTIIVIEKYFDFFHKLSIKSEGKISDYLKKMECIKKITSEKEILSKKLLNIERKINKIENDLRFYKNLLK